MPSKTLIYQKLAMLLRNSISATLSNPVQTFYFVAVFFYPRNVPSVTANKKNILFVYVSFVINENRMKCFADTIKRSLKNPPHHKHYTL